MFEVVLSYFPLINDEKQITKRNAHLKLFDVIEEVNLDYTRICNGKKRIVVVVLSYFPLL